MTLNGWLQILVFLAAVFAVTPPIGAFMSRVFSGRRTWLDPILRPVERLIYRLTGVDERRIAAWSLSAVKSALVGIGKAAKRAAATIRPAKSRRA